MEKSTANPAKLKRWGTAVLAAGFLAYACFNLVLLVLHQPYRDEANVWLMAKYLSPVSLLKEIHYQAHPCLWYFMVMPFAKLGLPYKTIDVVSFLVMLATAVIFLRRANVHGVVKLFFLASPFCTYFYPVIARNYCLIALFMMICGCVYPVRNERPVVYGLILGLLVQADSIAVAVAGALSFAWLCEAAADSIKQKSRTGILTAAKGLWIPLASLLFLILQVAGVSDNQAYGVHRQGIRELLQAVKYYSFWIMRRMTGWSDRSIVIFLAVFVAVCIWLSVLAGTAAPLFVTVTFYLFQACFSALFHELHIWHFLSLGFVVIWMLWVLKDRIDRTEHTSRSGRVLFVASELLVVLLAVCMIGHWNSEEEVSSLDRALHAPYSDGGNAARFVRENIPQDAVIVTADVAYSSSILANLDGYEFICAGSRRPAVYATWSEEEISTVSFGELDAWIRETYPGIREYYVIQTVVSCFEDAQRLQQFEAVYVTPQSTTKNEDFTIYRVQTF